MWRMYVSHRRMLEWTTAAEAQAAAGTTVGAYARLMAPASVLACVAAAPGARPLAGIALVPHPGPRDVAAVSRARLAAVAAAAAPPPVEAPNPGQILALRGIARRTWRFFERFVSDEDHWLPPDNYQEDPKGEIAHRTSPTNMGLALLANVTAHDLGYLSLSGLDLPRGTDASRRWRDSSGSAATSTTGTTRSRSTPLRPAYVSTVDSGNLAGHLLALRTALKEAVRGAARRAAGARRDRRRAAPRARGPARCPGSRHDLVRRRRAVARHRRAAAARRPGRAAPLAGRLGDAARRTCCARPSRWRSARPACAARTAMPPKRSPRRRRRSGASTPTSRPTRRGRGSSPPFRRRSPRIPGRGPSCRWSATSRPWPPSPGSPRPSSRLSTRSPRTRRGATTPERALTAAWAAAVAAGLRDAVPVCAELLARAQLMGPIAREMWEHADLRMLYDAGPRAVLDRLQHRAGALRRLLLRHARQ